MGGSLDPRRTKTFVWGQKVSAASSFWRLLQPALQQSFIYEEAHAATEERDGREPASLGLKFRNQIGCRHIKRHAGREGKAVARERSHLFRQQETEKGSPRNRGRTADGAAPAVSSRYQHAGDGYALRQLVQ